MLYFICRLVLTIDLDTKIKRELVGLDCGTIRRYVTRRSKIQQHIDDEDSVLLEGKGQLGFKNVICFRVYLFVQKSRESGQRITCQLIENVYKNGRRIICTQIEPPFIIYADR
ncbi:hypothetical protein HZS_3363 [Henneguya salminicola]|nr:hypothetical protein HZS_3363 [Henneguya salminicola]